VKSRAAKRIEREFAAEAKRARLPVGDAAALEAEVTARKAARERENAELLARAEAELARLRERLAGPSEVAGPAEDVAVAGPEILQALRGMQSLAPRRSADELRANTLRTEIFPRLERWGFAARYQCEISDWRCDSQRRVFEECRRRLCGVGAVVALIGERGAGKTTIAAQLALARAWEEHRAIYAGESVRMGTFFYRKATDLVRRLKPLYANFGSIDADRLEASLRALCAVDVLVIDEMHDLSELAVREALLIDLVDRRYSARKDTLLISNQTPAEWDDAQTGTPASIRSRIEEHGCVMPCEWGSWRANGGRGEFGDLARRSAF
jgi:DNA replication protein DnaC